MASYKSDALLRYKHQAKLTGVPDLAVIRESIDQVGVSKTDDKVTIGQSKVNVNPRLEKSGAAKDVLNSVDFDSEK